MSSALVLACLIAVLAPQDVPERFLERTLAAHEALVRGELERARYLFAANLERFPEHANSAYALACVEAREGNDSAGLDWLARAVEWGFADADVATWDRDLEALRGESRFHELIASMRAKPMEPGTQARLIWWETGGDADLTREGNLRPLLMDCPELALAPDTPHLVVPCGGGELRTVDLTTARTLSAWRPRSVTIDFFSFLKDGSRLFVAWRDSECALLDAQSGAIQRRIDLSVDIDPRSLIVNDDGRRGVAVSGGKYVLLDLESGAMLSALGQVKWEGFAALHSDTGRTATPQPNGSIAVWDLETGQRIGSEYTTRDEVLALAFSHDGRLLACGTRDAGLYVWNVADGSLARHHQVPDAFDESRDVRDLSFEASGETLVFTTGDHWTVRRLELSSGADTLLVDAQGGNASTVRARPSASGKRLFVQGLGLIVGDPPVFDSATGDVLVRLGGESARWVGGTSDDAFVACTLDNGVRVSVGARLESTYTFVPFEDGAWLTSTGAFHCAGTAEVLRWTVIGIGDENYPFASFAATLLDPKRVLAAAAGIAVRPAKFGTPPRVRLVGEPIRQIAATAEFLEVEVELLDPIEIVDVEASLNGVVLSVPREALAAYRVGDGPLRLAFPKPRDFQEGGRVLRLVMFDRSGIGSPPVRVRFMIEG